VKSASLPAPAADPNHVPARCSEVTAYLRSRGHGNVSLVRGRGYFYFAGEAAPLRETSVMTYRLGAMSLGEWEAELVRLKSAD
jgi:hypothetical protein